MLLDFNTHLGRYEIRSLLGAGGMGEVYLAQDSTLRRLVALKVLPSDLTRDPGRLRRFELEAFAASALNHPNIITIYEIGQIDGTQFIATEFIDGITLRQRIADGEMTLTEALDVAIQAAGALVAAHEAGIVHRDIKPENLMLRRDGYVKVLDFGLAKLAQEPLREAGSDPNALTKIMTSTEPGVLMGTVSYMSPEQAQGQVVDARTDSWSLGMVLYEMLSGDVPFKGPTNSHIIVSLLEDEPPPLLTRDGGQAPAELERIVGKALQKNREERYQTIKDLLLDLKSFKRKLEISIETEPFTRVSFGGRDAVTHTTAAAEIGSAGEHPVRVTEADATRLTLKSEVKLNGAGRRKQALFAAMLVVIASGILFGFYKFLNRSGTVPSFENMKMAKLTNNGRAIIAAISPDGKHVVYATGDAGRQSLWIRMAAAASTVQIVAPAEVIYHGLTFSPDGTYIYYVARDKNMSIGDLYRVPALGGVARKLLEKIDTPVSFAPDGKQFAFVRNDPNKGESALMVAQADGTEVRQLATRNRPNTYDWPAWSPDGKVIACVARNVAGGLHMSVVEVPAGGGGERVIAPQKWAWCGQIQWAASGHALLITADDAASGTRQVWSLSYPDGEARKVTNDTNSYIGSSLTSDASALVTVQTDQTSNIWTATLDGASSRVKQITSGKNLGAGGVAWTPDNRVVYGSLEGGVPDIWSMDDDGGNQRQLTLEAGKNYLPVVSHDNRYIAFVSDRAGTYNIWRMDSDGGRQTQLTSGRFDGAPSFFPDHQSIAFFAWGSDKPTINQVSIDGGQLKPLSSAYSYMPVVSPDGKLISYHAQDQNSSTSKLIVVATDSGQVLKTFDLPATPTRWMTDGSAVLYVDSDNGGANIWSQPIAGGKPSQLTNFSSEQIFYFDLSRDGKYLVISRGTKTSDVILISNVK